MKCYECLTHDQQGTEAVAVCVRCGAATCAAHTHAGHAYTELHSPGASHREDPGRRLYCTTCNAGREQPADAAAPASTA